MSKRGLFLCLCAVFAVYSVYVWTVGTNAPHIQPPSKQAKAGLALFQEKNCIACHQLYGLGGHMGPDLTNVASAPNKGVDYLKSFIANGTDKMPDFKFSEAEIDALAQFLVFLDQTGTYPPAHPEIRWYGSVAYSGSNNGK